MILRALIVDDEYPAREELRYHLKEYDNIKIVGEAGKVSEAMELIDALHYDVVFLDVNMPSESGIDLGVKLLKKENPPCIIYITAYEEYAVEAFDVNAVGYVLKPIDEDKLRRAIEKVTRILKKKGDSNSAPVMEAPTASELKIIVPVSSGVAGKISAFENDKTVLVDTNDIYFAYVDTNYVFIKKYDIKLITKYTLLRLEEKLTGENFMRISRSHLVNISKIKEISPFFNGRCTITLADKESTKIQVSRRQSSELKKLFDL
jgi:two-component system LytT family response regulator